MNNEKSRALRFVVLVGIISFFADFTYEGARSVAGPYLALLGASGLVVGLASGLGELVGYGLRYVSGRVADRLGQYWPLVIAGYAIQLCAVPTLALATSWQMAVALLVLERVGKAVRNPARNVLLSHAGHEMQGYGWAFGLHEALDQAGALVGPLVMAGVLAERHNYRLAFAVLLIPATCALALVIAARVMYPQPKNLERPVPTTMGHLGRAFWLYLVAAGLVAAGFADFPLIAFHLEKGKVISAGYIPIFYAIAMGIGGLASLLFGWLFDRRGIIILVPLTIFSAAYAPLAFFGGPALALGGVILWGVATGVHESVMAAVVAQMVAAERRASAYGLFMAVFGVAWFGGSVLLGGLYDVSPHLLSWVAAAIELSAVPFLLAVARLTRPHAAPTA